MKIQLSRKLKQMASALLVVMVLGGILCLFVMYYLSLVEQQNRLSVRSQAWNIAIAVTEAGIEEGLQALNSGAAPLASDRWSANGTVYSRTNTLPGGNWYTVSINLTTPTAPSITARSYISLPTFAAAPSLTLFAVISPGGTGPTSSTLVSRAVKVTCFKNPTSLFTAALVSKHVIDLKGNGVATDSYDSSNPAKSTYGKYDPSKYTGDFGDVATIDSLIVGVQQANIYGKLHTGPTGGYSMGTQGGVGTHAWQAAHGGGMQPDYFFQDANFTFPDTTLPNTTGYLTPQPGDIVTTSYNFTSNSTTTATLPSPLPAGGILTNVTYSTVSAQPSSIPTGTITNTTTVTSVTYPSSVPPGGVATNITGYTTVATKPSPTPAGTTTNTIWVTNVTLPNPIPAGMITMTAVTTTVAKPATGTYTGSVTTNTTVTTTEAYPAAGTYTGSVTTIPGKNKSFPTKYSYNLITGYTCNLISGYKYPTYTYNVPSSFSYTYTGYTYTYPNYTFTYNLYHTTAVYATNHYDNVLLANHSYVSSALNGNTVVQGPNVRLVLPNGLSGSENLLFNYADNNSPGLTVYAGGTSASISGNQYINPSGFAGSLIVYCCPTVTSFTLNGNGQFTGVLVAPNADLTMNGGGNSDQDFCGSLMVNNVRLNGHFKFHWDESLGRMKSDNGARYLVKTWNEIP